MGRSIRAQPASAGQDAGAWAVASGTGRRPPQLRNAGERCARPAGEARARRQVTSLGDTLQLESQAEVFLGKVEGLAPVQDGRGLVTACEVVETHQAFRAFCETG